MKLATKLVSIFMLIVLLVIAVDGWWSVREETAQYEQVQKREIVRLARLLKTAVFVGAVTPDRALALVDRMNAEPRHLPCRWVWLDGTGESRPHAPVASRDLMAAEEGVLFPVEIRERDLRLAYVHVPVADRRTGGLELEADSDTIDRLRTMQTVRSLRVAGLLLLLSAVAGVFFGHRLVAAPLQQLIDKTRRIGRGDLTGPVAVRTRDELGELGTALNRMCDDLETSRARAAEEQSRRIDAVEQLRHADRLRTVGQLAAGIAHEMGTPLNVVAGRAEMIAGARLTPDEVTESARVIKEQSERISTIVRQLLDFARSGAPDKSVVDARAIAERTVQLLAPVAKKSGVELTVTAPPGAVNADVDAGQIQQVLTNLVVNAIQAMPEGGPVTVRVTSVTSSPPEMPDTTGQPYVRIDVDDAGAGIPADDVERVFDPFFTTKEVGQGTGMGLSVAYGIVREHDGWITVEPLGGRAGSGTRFSVFLPREPEA